MKFRDSGKSSVCDSSSKLTQTRLMFSSNFLCHSILQQSAFTVIPIRCGEFNYDWGAGGELPAFPKVPGCFRGVAARWGEGREEKECLRKPGGKSKVNATAQNKNVRK